METNEYIKKWLAGNLSEEERAAFEKTSEYSELQKLDQKLKQFRAPDFSEKEEYDMLKRKMAKSTSFNKAKVVKINFWPSVLKVAASIIILMVIGYSLFNTLSTVKESTELASQSALYLPDSSKVSLNAASRVSYHNFNWENNRTVDLEGEAFFQVAKGSTFDVITAMGMVSVLGTEFNVNIQKDLFEVVCYEGLVQVSYENQLQQIKPGQMFRVLQGATSMSNVKISDKPSWIDHESSFVSMPYGFVLDEFERQYQRTIVTKSVNENMLFTGSFVHGNLDLALQSLTTPMRLSYTINSNKEIVIVGGQ